MVRMAMVGELSANVRIATSMRGTLEVVVVTRPDELAPALRQHEAPVVIDNERIGAKFRRLSYWEGKQQTLLLGWVAALLVGLLTFAISQRYGIDAGWKAKWHQIEFEGKIKLTPKS
jgi:hypothetical protein